MNPHQLRTITAAAFTAFAFAVFAAPAPAEPAESVRTDPYYHQTQDLRSPDARDAVAPAPSGPDLRSPDTRDAALISQGRMEQPTTTTAAIHPVPSPAAVPPPSSGFDWLDAGIGAAGALGLALTTTGIMLAIRRRSHRDQLAIG